jgi:hypothetical protein
VIFGERHQSGLDYPGEDVSLEQWKSGRFTDVWVVLHPFRARISGQVPPRWLPAEADLPDGNAIRAIAEQVARQPAANQRRASDVIRSTSAETCSWSNLAAMAGLENVSAVARALMTANMALPTEDMEPDHSSAVKSVLDRLDLAAPEDGYIVSALEPIALVLMHCCGEKKAIAGDAMGMETEIVDDSMLGRPEASLAQRLRFIPNSLQSNSGAWLFVTDWDKPFSLLALNRNQLANVPIQPREPIMAIDRLDWWRVSNQTTH